MRTQLVVMAARYLSMITFASARERNHSRLRHLSRKLAVEALGDAILPGLAFSLERAVPGDVQPIVYCSHCHSDLQGSKAFSERAERAKRTVALLPCARLR